MTERVKQIWRNPNLDIEERASLLVGWWVTDDANVSEDGRLLPDADVRLEQMVTEALKHAMGSV